MTIERYQRQHLIGKGPMSAVWLARDTDTHDEVALKIMTAIKEDDRRNLKANERFTREIEIARSLQHPHILPVLDSGYTQYNGRSVPFLVSPFIPDGSLVDVIEASPSWEFWSLPQIADAIQQAADSLWYLHTRTPRIVHEDVKPANFLVRSIQTPQRAYHLYLSDFGISRWQKSPSVMASEVLGTFAFMAPEQTEKRVDPASDQYALAIVACYLLTGKLPIQASTNEEYIHAHLYEPPYAPSELYPERLPPSKVDDVLLRALEKSPTKRYPTIIAFAQALEQACNELAQELASARTELLADPGFDPGLYIDEEPTAPLPPDEVFDEEIPAPAPIEQSFSRKPVLSGEQPPRNNLIPAAEQGFKSRPVPSDEQPFRGNPRKSGEQPLRGRLSGEQPLRERLSGEQPFQNNLAPSVAPAFKSKPQIVELPFDNRPIALSDTDSRDEHRPLDEPLPEKPSVAVAPTVSAENVVFQPLVLASPARYELPARPKSLLWSPNGAMVACLLYGHVPLVLQRNGSAGLVQIPVALHASSLCWSPDSRILAIGLQGEIRFWDVSAGTELPLTIPINARTIDNMDWSRQGQLAVWVNTSIALYPLSSATLAGRQVPTPQHITTGTARSGSAGVLRWSPNGVYLAAGASNGAVLCWNATQQNMLWQAATTGQKVNALAWSPDSTLLVCAVRDSSVQAWNVETRSTSATWQRLPAMPRTLSVSVEQRIIVASGERRLLSAMANEGFPASTIPGQLLIACSPTRPEFATLDEQRENVLALWQA